MGLDMTIYGRGPGVADKYPEDWAKGMGCELAYWRKHPNLHGFIVQVFADGVDECQEIPLDADDIEQIIEATHHDGLPHTEGFFFGTSGWSDDHAPVAVRNALRNVLHWLARDTRRTVYYKASW